MKHLHSVSGRLPLLLTGLLFTAIYTAHAQPGSGGPQPSGPISTPLDGGASLLLAGAVAYGVRRLRRNRPQ